MKKVTVAFLVAFAFALPAQAASDEFCRSISEYAKSMMKLRLSGAPLGEALKYEIKDDDGRSRGVIIDAYKQPYLHDLGNHRVTAINEFGNKWMLRCFDRM